MTPSNRTQLRRQLRKLMAGSDRAWSAIELAFGVTTITPDECLSHFRKNHSLDDVDGNLEIAIFIGKSELVHRECVRMRRAGQIGWNRPPDKQCPMTNGRRILPAVNHLDAVQPVVGETAIATGLKYGEIADALALKEERSIETLGSGRTGDPSMHRKAGGSVI